MPLPDRFLKTAEHYQNLDRALLPVHRSSLENGLDDLSQEQRAEKRLFLAFFELYTISNSMTELNAVTTEFKHALHIAVDNKNIKLFNEIANIEYIQARYFFQDAFENKVCFHDNSDDSDNSDDDHDDLAAYCLLKASYSTFGLIYQAACRLLTTLDVNSEDYKQIQIVAGKSAHQQGECYLSGYYPWNGKKQAHLQIAINHFTFAYTQLENLNLVCETFSLFKLALSYDKTTHQRSEAEKYCKKAMENAAKLPPQHVLITQIVELDTQLKKQIPQTTFKNITHYFNELLQERQNIQTKLEQNTGINYATENTYLLANHQKKYT